MYSCFERWRFSQQPSSRIETFRVRRIASLFQRFSRCGCTKLLVSVQRLLSQGLK